MRRNQEVILKNTKHNGHWEKEERFGGFPVVGTETFNLGILATEDHFQIYINQLKYCTFAYRQPLSQGDVVEFLGIAEYLIIDNESDISSLARNSIVDR